MSGERRQSSKKRAVPPPIELRPAEQIALQALDDIAVSHALHRGDPAPVVRYLREVVTPLIQHRVRGAFGSTATIGLLADMLEGRDSALRHLQLVRPRPGMPTDSAKTALDKIEIGRHVAAHPNALPRDKFIGPLRPVDRQPVLKAAIADISAEFLITPDHAYKCLKLYELHCFHNERGEPMPIPERPVRRRVKTNIQKA